MPTNTVLILGARGRFGLAAARAFAAAGWRVLGQVRPANVAPTLVASRTALPPEGAAVALGRPGGDWSKGDVCGESAQRGLAGAGKDRGCMLQR